MYTGAKITGLILSLSAGGAKVVHVMTGLTRVRTQLVGPRILFQEGISGKMLTNQIKCAINFKVQEVARMAMHASFNT